MPRRTQFEPDGKAVGIEHARLGLLGPIEHDARQGVDLGKRGNQPTAPCGLEPADHVGPAQQSSVSDSRARPAQPECFALRGGAIPRGPVGFDELGDRIQAVRATRPVDVPRRVRLGVIGAWKRLRPSAIRKQPSQARSQWCGSRLPAGG